MAAMKQDLKYVTTKNSTNLQFGEFEQMSYSFYFGDVVILKIKMCQGLGGSQIERAIQFIVV